MITCQRAHEVFRYDYETGVITWKVDLGKKVKAGKVAGCLLIEPKSRTPYRRIGIDGGMYKAHRLVWLMHYGVWPEGNLDHKNGDGDDNRIENLRKASHVESARNRPRRSNNTSGVNGVWWRKDSSKWVAQIRINGRVITVGRFSSLDEAAMARKDADKRYGFSPSHGRSSVDYSRTVDASVSAL